MVVINQMRKSGGMWLTLGKKNILLDPGPGCLVRCTDLGLDPGKLDAIAISHRHIDHTNDVNIMIEAMSGGGFKPKGALLAPRDCLEGEDPVVLRYVRGYIHNNIHVIGDGFECTLDGVAIKAAVRLHHAGVDAYGLRFPFEGKTLGYVADTEYFDELPYAFRGCDYLIVNMVRMTHDKVFQHLIPGDVIKLLKVAKPGMAILNHFGMQIVKAPPEAVAARIENETGVHTIAAEDGMRITLDDRKHETKNMTLESFIE